MADFDDILNSCLDWLRQGKSVEECLAAYPDQAEELRELLYTALKTREAFSAVGLRPEGKAQAQYRLLSQPRPVYRPWWLRRWAVAVMPVLAILLLGGGTVLAANNSLPGEPLYGVKMAVEQLQSRLPRSGLVKAQYQLELAEKRMEEMSRLVGEQKPQAVGQAGQQMIEHLKKIKQSMEAMKPADAAKLRSRLIQRASQHRQQLRTLKQVLPAPSPAPLSLEDLELEREGDKDWEGEYEKFLETLLQEER